MFTAPTISLLSELAHADKIDWSRAAADSSSIRAVGGGEATGPNPTDRGRPGTKHHILVDGQGVPLAVTITGANVPDLMQLLPLVVAVPPVAGKRGRPRSRPKRLYADRAYDSGPVRRILRWLGIAPVIAERGVSHGSGLGRFRWVVERTLAWLHQQRRLRIRYDRRDDIHIGFFRLATCLICCHTFLGLC